MTPRLLQLNISSGGIPKRPVSSARLTFSRVEGDSWNDTQRHGHPDQAVCLFSIELIEELKAEGYPLFPGALGENFTTQGVDYRQIRQGDIFRVGKEATIRITKVRVPCRTIAVYGEGILRATYDADVKAGNILSPKWGRSGFYAEVLQEGVVSVHDPLIMEIRQPMRQHA